MSNDMIRIIGEMKHRDLNTQLALQCAPLLTGNKISNLLNVNYSEKREVISMFKNTEISLFILFQTESRITFLLYRKEKLLQYIQKESVRNLMIKLGYREYELKNILCELKKRYYSYMLSRESFPHELGLVLEYPVEDVVGFMENEGRNFLYTGYWKVYHNLPNALEIFDQYNKAKERVLHLLSQGFPMNHILDLCNSNVLLQRAAV